LLHPLSAPRHDRLALATCTAVAVLVTAREARAFDICDPAGHFCVVLDAPTARICDATRPGAWDPSTCERSDASKRQLARLLARETGGSQRVLASVVVRFDDWRADMTVVREPDAAEIADDAALAKYAARFAEDFNQVERKEGWLWEATDPPRLTRVRGVQIARLRYQGASAGIGGAVRVDLIKYGVFTEGAMYTVTFITRESENDRLAAFAEATIASLDARPRNGASADDVGKWLARAVIAALLLAGAWILGHAWARRRGKRAISPRDLWPTD
jgi:hypothetical protein